MRSDIVQLARGVGLVHFQALCVDQASAHTLHTLQTLRASLPQKPRGGELTSSPKAEPASKPACDEVTEQASSYKDIDFAQRAQSSISSLGSASVAERARALGRGKIPKVGVWGSGVLLELLVSPVVGGAVGDELVILFELLVGMPVAALWTSA